MVFYFNGLLDFENWFFLSTSTADGKHQGCLTVQLQGASTHQCDRYSWRTLMPRVQPCLRPWPNREPEELGLDPEGRVKKAESSQKEKNRANNREVGQALGWTE